MRSRLTGCVAVVLMVFILAPPVVRASQDQKKLQEVKEQLERERKNLEELHSKKTSVLELLETLDRRIHDASQEERRLGGNVRNLEQKIAESEGEIEEKHRALERQRALVNRRMIALYKMGDLGAVKILFSATSFTDLLRRSHDLKQIIGRDLEMVRSFHTSLKELQALRADLERQKAGLGEAHDKAALSRQKLQAEKAQKGKVVAAIESEEGVRKRYISELEEAQKDLEKLMDRLAKKKATESKGSEVAESGFAAKRGKLKAPVKGKIVKPFGKFKDPKYYTYTFHKGIDVSAAANAPVKSIYQGKVVYSGWFKGFGQILIIDHGGGYHTLTAKTQDLEKAVGDEVKEGEVIGRLAEKGPAGGRPLLYLEVRQQGQSVDPMIWIAKRELQ